VRKKGKIVLFLLISIILFVLIGLISNIRIVFEEEQLSYDKELSFAHITDTHFNETYNESHYDKIITRINSSESDVLVFTGDLFELDEISIELEEDITKLLKQITIEHKIAVLGNHDYYNQTKTETTIRILENSGFTVLVNEDIDLVINDQNIHFIGLDDYRFGDNDYEEILKTSEDYEVNFVLSHEPDTFKEVKTYKIEAMFSGHSHGGQFRLPIVGHILMVYGAREYPNHYYYENDTELFTSFGCGETIIPLRFYNPRVINFYKNS
jgi:predicted MPP superfamily phosphohydrolase